MSGNCNIKIQELDKVYVQSLLNEIELLKRRISDLKKIKQVEVSFRRTKLILNVERIVMIRAESNYSRIYIDNSESYLTSKTLKYWENKISSDTHKRIHASFLVNMNSIVKLNVKEGNIYLKNGLLAKMSRSKFKKYRQSLGKDVHEIVAPKIIF